MSYLLAGLRAGIERALRGAVEAARPDLGLDSGTAIPPFTVEVPREKNHGDFATNLALLLTKPARRSPRQIAEILVSHLSLPELLVKEVTVAGPGFINFRLDPNWLHGVLPEIETWGEHYGRRNLGGGRKVQVEFVSANPTGLLHMGNARGAALGDSIAALLSFVGFDVTREFYVNDAGHQVENLALSMEARYFQALGRDWPVPEDGYHGEDLIDTAGRFVAEHGDRFASGDPDERRGALLRFALEEKLAAMRATLESFGVRYDVWFSEQSLYDRGVVGETLELLKKRGHLYERDGALWFKAGAFGGDKDEVLVRRNGVPTYFAADIAYHKDKYDRGFDWVINVWGADHHGHVPRMKGALAALGYDPDALDVVIMQLVRLYRGGEIVRMSKRTGRYVTLDELLEEVGRDAARYFFVTRGADSHLDFDLDLAKSRTNENPVYYIQYAHARISSIFRQLEERGRTAPGYRKIPDVTLLKEEAERALIRRLADFPDEVAQAAYDLAPHRIAHYVHDLAGLFHHFYNAHRVLGAGDGLEEARLMLVNCTRVVLRNALTLLGVSAPERM
ncbi:arginine--tRNA ligase [Candidatus Desulforudis audaxviator]|uniref:Arginine--tRNA ligase n=1 Tax=Desulforudis audaxviator (strain MP104C) TaxID=477974 RepID=SYR_DESAP|nr:arginine--tRNA ligase [Candidatus Desulforudis audaxviator]B1I6Q5.1 RecName: Full=Arginine--tRNA ligase; AltName: Full=Arginyl-tRNA synthetase; Short=ArgRS [Candidatus Desulforudis audaxviator MP104C]ACA60668.1 arginyl-tRNA synthetase [Candidatus Desulforudis audaxviator MP104C]AZK60751.1 Arginyl-tRNA synthetase [Candidatus Desulforudis audaxviator]